MHDGTDRLAEAYAYIDARGGSVIVAEVELGLANGVSMTVRAGGGAVTSSPPDPPFATYEVLLSQDPPRFWRRYTDDSQLLYSNVPQLLVTHQVSRSGGVVTMSASTSFVEAPKRTAVRLPITTMEELAVILSEIAGRPVGREVLRW